MMEQVRALDGKHGNKSTAHRKRYAARLNRVLDYIQQHLDEPLDLAGLSVVAASSPYHFHRAFTASTGMPVRKLVQLMRLRRASQQLAFNPHASITDIGLAAGFANAESFSRAFRKVHGQTPSAFRRNPDWHAWQVTLPFRQPEAQDTMHVDLVDFPATLIAALEHHGPERLTHKTTMKFIDWRRANGVKPDQGETYGIHYSDPVNTLPEDYRFDIAVSVAKPVAPNGHGVVTKTIPAGRCARVRHVGSRHFVAAAEWLYREWLPGSGEQVRDFPIFFHYVNVGPDVKEREMITDVYLPLK
jgi:AraC family transcriptional regulator